MGAVVAVVVGARVEVGAARAESVAGPGRNENPATPSTAPRVPMTRTRFHRRLTTVPHTVARR